MQLVLSTGANRRHTKSEEQLTDSDDGFAKLADADGVRGDPGL